jgi:hypothetical protein
MDQEGIEVELPGLHIDRSQGGNRRISLVFLGQVGTVIASVMFATFTQYLNFHDRMQSVEFRMKAVEDAQAEEKADIKDQFNRVNNKLDQLIANQPGSRPDMRGYMK